MGGRGSMGGTRSTYRGDSTAKFRELQNKSLFQNNLNNQGDSSNGGGGSSKGSDKTKKSGVTDNNNGGGGGGGGSVTPTPAPKDTTDTNDQPLPHDVDLESLFQASQAFKDFDKRYENASEAIYEKKYQEALSKWIGIQNVQPKPEKAKPGLPFRRKADNRRISVEQLLADVEPVNMNYRRDRGEWDINCQRCTMAVELRAQGYDVKAQSILEGYKRKAFSSSTGNIIGSSASVDQIAQMWKNPDTGEIGSWDHETADKVSRDRAIKLMEDEIRSWGEGARGFIYVTWAPEPRGGGAHIWNVEVRNGEPFYIDGQTGKIGADVEDWKSDFDPTTWRGVMRVDNLVPANNRVESWVKERTSEEINAPSQQELIAELNRTWPLGSGPENTALRNSFFAAWDAVRKGRDTTPSAIIAATPELLEAFNKGLAWARRPD